VHPEPGMLDGVAQARPKLRWAALELGQEGPVDQLDEDPVLLRRLNAGREPIPDTPPSLPPVPWA
jgi:hypothetical protein